TPIQILPMRTKRNRITYRNPTDCGPSTVDRSTASPPSATKRNSIIYRNPTVDRGPIDRSTARPHQLPSGTALFTGTLPWTVDRGPSTDHPLTDAPHPCEPDVSSCIASYSSSPPA